MLLSKAWELYESDKRIEGLSDNTLVLYRLQSKLLINHFIDVCIETVTTEQLIGYLEKSNEYLTRSSLSHQIRIIKNLFCWAFEEGYIQNNPSSMIKVSKQEKRINTYSTEEEFDNFKIAFFTPLEKVLFQCMFSTGFRLNESVSFKKTSINTPLRCIWHTGKFIN